MYNTLLEPDTEALVTISLPTDAAIAVARRIRMSSQVDLIRRDVLEDLVSDPVAFSCALISRVVRAHYIRCFV
jgi:hypothetical protein